MLPNTSIELTPDQITQLQQAKDLIPKLRVQIQRAEQAGIDVTQQKSDLATLEAQVNKLYGTYVRKSNPTSYNP